MSYWNGRTAVVTGAASGIGFALSEAMISRGAKVWLTDINEDGVREAAEQLGTSARWRALDVCDAAAVHDLIAQVADETGIDFLFNNAGVGVGGESHLLKVAHWDRTIDINIRGVTNGVAAAYPRMVKQGHGHIVNTASAAGLVPAPLLTPYSMTKHAVVGLTKSLRLEAVNYGVRVSALCPTAIETPILDSEAPADLADQWQPDVRRYLTKLGGPPYPVEKFAAQALQALERNRDIIVIPASGRVASFLYRLFPGLVTKRINQAMAQELDTRPS